MKFGSSILAFGALTLAAIGMTGAARSAEADLVPVKIAVIGSSGQAEVTYVLKKYGIDRKHGLDVQEIDYAQPGQQYTMMRSDAADVADAGNFLDLHRQRKAGNRILAFHGYQHYSNQIVVKADSPLKTFPELKGKKVGEFGTTFLDWLIVRAAGKKAHSVDLEKDATPVQGAPPLLNQLLTKGQIDATLQFSSLTLGPLTRGEQRTIVELPGLMHEAGFNPDAFYILWLVTENWTKAHPGAIEKLDAAIHEAYGVLMKDDSVWPALAQKIGIKDEASVAGYRDLARKIDNPPYDKSLLQPTQELLDALVSIAGEQAIGLSKLDSEAFVFPRH